MKIRALARSLRLLADWLDTLPDQSLDELKIAPRPDHPRGEALALNVATLAGLSRIDRSAWITFISEHKFPIEVRARDASRDILGKLLRYLESRPDAVEYLQWKGSAGAVGNSDLSRALKALLNYPG
jgi:hypothetical protein